MVYEVVVPKLGVSVNEAKIIQWLRHEGDTISTGEPFFTVETEKTTVDVEANVTGKIVKIIHPEGVTLQAGRVVALVAQPDENPPPQVIQAKLAEILARETKQEPVPEKSLSQLQAGPPQSTAPTTSEQAVRASPAARRLMRDYKIAPDSIVGTGPASTITVNDVMSAVQKLKPQSDLRITSSTELSGTRLTIARRLTQINTEAVHVTLLADVDVTALSDVKSRHSADRPPPTMTELLISVVARTLRLHPQINAVFEENKIKIIDNINVAVAVDTPDGLRVPVVKDADKLALSQIVEKVRTLTERAKTGKIALEEMNDGTFTLTNLGMFGVEGFTPIINPPQCAILGVGAIQDKPVVIEGQITIRKVMTLSLSFDHRVMDGVAAARFLKDLKESISRGGNGDL
jgi:pyruvate dehydrogenase E2 component (dihydrolipoamide acetyltransferase)